MVQERSVAVQKKCPHRNISVWIINGICDCQEGCFAVCKHKGKKKSKCF